MNYNHAGLKTLATVLTILLLLGAYWYFAVSYFLSNYTFEFKMHHYVLSGILSLIALFFALLIICGIFYGICELYQHFSGEKWDSEQLYKTKGKPND